MTDRKKGGARRPRARAGHPENAPGTTELSPARDQYKHKTCGQFQPLPDMPTHCGTCGWNTIDHPKATPENAPGTTELTPTTAGPAADQAAREHGARLLEVSAPKPELPDDEPVYLAADQERALELAAERRADPDTFLSELLRAPFPVTELTTDGEPTPLAVMRRLDQAAGPFGWSLQQPKPWTDGQHGGILVGLTIHLPSGRWVTRWAGADFDVDAGLVAAAATFGVGRDQPRPAAEAPPAPQEPAGPIGEGAPGPEPTPPPELPEGGIHSGGYDAGEPAPVVAPGPYQPTEKQVGFYVKLMQAHVWTPDERERLTAWLATKATRQTIKDQIDWMRRQVEARNAQGRAGVTLPALSEPMPGEAPTPAPAPSPPERAPAAPSAPDADPSAPSNWDRAHYNRPPGQGPGSQPAPERRGGEQAHFRSAERRAPAVTAEHPQPTEEPNGDDAFVRTVAARRGGPPEAKVRELLGLVRGIPFPAEAERRKWFGWVITDCKEGNVDAAMQKLRERRAELSARQPAGGAA
jgi:hypothetical protein